MIERWGDESRLPALRAEGNNARGNRFFLGNTKKSSGEARSTASAAFLDYFSARGCFCPRKKSMCFSTLSLLWLIGLFWHKMR